ncbi:hypothetical protein MRB53_016615 [Persea americana]|uniref:Uncharacterized protein n=1 Tax=Persea americana TaxID=3435 RepID=A0ACC2M3L6_PERAE|nr:hypothetical protein MRB53_016615 [Persea americana]
MAGAAGQGRAWKGKEEVRADRGRGKNGNAVHVMQVELKLGKAFAGGDSAGGWPPEVGKRRESNGRVHRGGMVSEFEGRAVATGCLPVEWLVGREEFRLGSGREEQ